MEFKPGQIVCLCAEHSAMFQFGPKENEEDVVQQVLKLNFKADTGSRDIEVHLSQPETSGVSDILWSYTVKFPQKTVL